MVNTTLSYNRTAGLPRARHHRGPQRLCAEYEVIGYASLKARRHIRWITLAEIGLVISRVTCHPRLCFHARIRVSRRAQPEPTQLKSALPSPAAPFFDITSAISSSCSRNRRTLLSSSSSRGLPSGDSGRDDASPHAASRATIFTAAAAAAAGRGTLRGEHAAPPSACRPRRAAGPRRGSRPRPAATQRMGRQTPGDATRDSATRSRALAPPPSSASPAAKPLRVKMLPRRGRLELKRSNSSA
eukprot:scaffold2352_cov103-Isochrysis_galbana.AAC.7